MENVIGANIVPDFVASQAFKDYTAEFWGPWTCALEREGVTAEQVPKMKLAAFQRLCQYFWEELPDSPSIRHGAFWVFCDFAAEHCFG